MSLLLLDLKRQSERSGLRPDTSSLVSLSTRRDLLTEFGSWFSTGKYGLKAFCVAKLFFHKEIYFLLLRTNILMHFSSNN